MPSIRSRLRLASVLSEEMKASVRIMSLNFDGWLQRDGSLNFPISHYADEYDALRDMLLSECLDRVRKHPWQQPRQEFNVPTRSHCDTSWNKQFVAHQLVSSLRHQADMSLILNILAATLMQSTPRFCCFCIHMIAMPSKYCHLQSSSHRILFAMMATECQSMTPCQDVCNHISAYQWPSLDDVLACGRCSFWQQDHALLPYS